MTSSTPDRQAAPASGHAGDPNAAAGAVSAGPVTLVLSRAVRAGHEQAFEAVLCQLAGEVRRQPGHLDVTVLVPGSGGPRIYTIVSHFVSWADADAWLSNPGPGAAGSRGRAARRRAAAHPVSVHVNAVSPGATETETYRTGKSEQFLARLEAMSAFGRLGQPTEIAAVVAFLTSDAAG
jgi:heme-degrading monooxygenase HmoA